MPPAVIAAGIGAAVGIGGAIMGSNATRSAADTAARAAAQNTAANNALARETRAANAATLNPYVQTGYNATNRMSDLLGLGSVNMNSATPGAGGYLPVGARDTSAQTGGFSYVTPAPGAAGTPTPAFTPPGYTAPPAPGEPLQSNMPVNMPGAPVSLASNQVTGPVSPAQRLNSGVSYQALTSALSPYAGPLESNVGPYEEMTSGMIGTALDPGSFTDYREGSGYDWRMGEGTRALNMDAARQGAFQSGAADKALTEFGQNFASDERQKFLGELDRYVRYNDAFAQNERGYENALDRYQDDFARGERGYGDQRNAYTDTFAQNERSVENALGEYGDRFAQNERGYGDQRADYGRSYLQDQQRYADTYGLGERGYADARNDYARQYGTALGQYQDQWATGERQYGDARNDYNRAYGDNRYDSYLDRVAQQQGVGAGAASALAGVNTNYSNAAMANNTAMAQAQANAALVRGAANSQMYGQIAGNVGNVLGAYMQSQPQPAQQSYYPQQNYGAQPAYSTLPTNNYVYGGMPAYTPFGR